MFPFSLSQKIEFAELGKSTFNPLVANNNYGSGGGTSGSSAAGLSYSQGLLDGYSSNSGINSLTSGQFGATIGHMGFAASTGNMNSYNQGFYNGLHHR